MPRSSTGATLRRAVCLGPLGFALALGCTTTPLPPGDTSPDGAAMRPVDAATPPPCDASGPCSPLGTWLVTGTSMGGPGATFRFDLENTFVGWAPGADLAGAPTATGTYSWSLVSDGKGTPGPVLTILSSTGLNCPEFATFTTTFAAGCSTMTLEAHFDNCTGARLYLDGEVALTRK